MGYVVKVDNRGRIKLPKNLAKASSVIIIDSGSFFVGISIPKDGAGCKGSEGTSRKRC
ncbi:hypothetical protein [Sulfuracidifex metallicus]|uniref:hypothetical protein n=1 Tax=Sulfuracidifex metallicus TaxID=47303 RepID=UPI000B128889|nr:hypothetical protein [Sulfuracidifex metallicus]WOE50392.1 hypothetical protein RQ359_001917 [Sulfuracidifex metallicus DSM 6482 = JCM 9184]